MSKKTYEEPLPRDVRQIDPPEPAKYPSSKKGRGKWCRKKVGREHKPEVRVSTRWSTWLRHCAPYSWNTKYWNCRHELACSDCGKILQWSLKAKDCPDYQERIKAR